MTQVVVAALTVNVAQVTGDVPSKKVTLPVAVYVPSVTGDTTAVSVSV